MRKHLFIIIAITLACFSSCSKESSLPIVQEPDELSRRPIKPTVNEIPVTRPEIIEERLDLDDRIHAFSWKLFKQFYQGSKDNVLIAPYDIMSSLKYRTAQKGVEAQTRLYAMMDVNYFSDKEIDNYFKYTDEYFNDPEFLTYGPHVRYRKTFVQEPDRLIRTINFSGGWRQAFDKSETKKMIFHKADGSEEEVDMMYRVHRAYHHVFNAYTMVRIDVLDGNFDSFFILPNEGYTIDDVIKRISPSDFKCNDAKLVYLWMPKFNVQQRNMLDDDMLQQLGFSHADTRSESDDDPDIVKTIWQDCALSVTEKGFVDSLDMSWSISCHIPYSKSFAYFHLDRPFIYGVLQRFRNTPLIIGYYGY